MSQPCDVNSCSTLSIATSTSQPNRFFSGQAEAMKSRIFALEGSLDDLTFFESNEMTQLADIVTHIVHSAASVCCI